jgi:hypothetical protein
MFFLEEKWSEDVSGEVNRSALFSCCILKCMAGGSWVVSFLDVDLSSICVFFV